MTGKSEQNSHWELTAWVAIGLTWLVTAVLVFLGVRAVREKAHGQIVAREGIMLQAMVRAVRASEADDPFSLDDPLAVLAKMRHLEGVLALRLFSPQGDFVYSIPASVREDTIPEDVWDSLRELKPVSQFRNSMLLSDILLVTNAVEFMSWTKAIPAVEVYVPLQRSDDQSFDGVAWFLLNGREVADEFATSDQHLWLQAAVALAAAVAVTGTILGWTFHRLSRANRLLGLRTADLQRANQELSQSARVATLGAVTAHLLHGLRNPVTGLQSFVASRAQSEEVEEDAWRDALAATRRMETLIQQVVRVLDEHGTDLAYQVELVEVVEAVVQRARGLAERRGVRLALDGAAKLSIDNRTGSLLILLLSNLVENAIEASAAEKEVRIRTMDDPSPVIEVIDQGQGIPPAVRERLFQPQRSTKEGGSGLGLAISRQLALALGGTLHLVSTGPSGTIFRVELPGLPGLQCSSAASQSAAKHG